MFTKTLQFGKGYTGAHGKMASISKVLGEDSTGFIKEKLEADSAEKEHFNRAKTTVTLTWYLPSGLYQASERGEKWFFLVSDASGKFKITGVTTERAKKLAQLLSEGKTFDEARIASKESDL